MKKLLLMSMLFISGIGISQQWTYNATYSPGAGNPGGVNLEGDQESGITSWTNIQLGSQSTDLWSPATAIPFAFDFYGSPVTNFRASQTGLVTFDNSAVLPTVGNENLPSSNLPDSTICVAWDEFTASPPTGTNDEIQVATFGTAPNRQFWIRWYSIEMGNPSVIFSFFAVVLEESTNNIYVVDQYKNAVGSLSATVGVQLDATNATQYGTNTIAFSSTGSGYDDNSFYTFMPEFLINDNAGVVSMDNPLMPVTPGLENVDVTVRNYGTNDLNSFNVEWEAGGVLQTPITYSGSVVPSFTNSASFNVGSYTFPPGFTELKFWTTMPNGVADGYAPDDTLTINACTPLDGIYSIGGASADFATINEANDILMSCGVGGPVVFNIAPGVYNESITTFPINGSSATNTVTFNGGSSSTTSIVANTPAVIALAGADYITWKNLTVQNTVASNGFGFHLSDTSDYNVIDSCYILLDPTATFGVIGIVCSGDVTNDNTEGNAANYCTFSNNEIYGGEMGINMEGPSASNSWMQGISILNNDIHGMDDFGIKMDNQDFITIRGNKIYNLRSSFADGISCTDIANFDFSYNDVHAPAEGFDIEDANFDFTVTGQSSIINNMIFSESDIAVHLDDINQINIYHNNVYGYPGIDLNDFTSLDIRNNIFQSDTEYAFQSDESMSGNVVDFNVYWTPAISPVYVKDGGSIYGDLSAWQSGEPTLNGSSVEGDPVFISSSNLHVVGFAANNAGDNSVGVLDDIDGDSRPLAPATVVDIGADEYTLPGDNAGVLSMDSPINPLTPGLQNIDVTVANFGSNDLSSFNIEWEIDGVLQTPYTYAGAVIPAFNNSASLNLGSYNFPGGFTDLKFWTTSPNGVTDTDLTNDTLTILGCTELTGTYSVGGASADFATISAANSALMNCGIIGPVVFNIAPGIYNESITTSTVNGSSATNTITFNGGSALTTSMVSDAPAVIALDAASYITWKNMTVENTTSSAGFGFHLGNASNYNLIDSCIILLDSTVSTEVIGIVCSASVVDDDAEGNASNYSTFSNNEIFGGAMGIHMEGPDASADWMKGMQILNNELHKMDDYGINVDNQDSITVIGNKIYDVRSFGGDGIVLFDIANFDVSYNDVIARDYGMYISDGNVDLTVTGQSRMINNISISENDYGLYMDDIEYVDFYHNTLYGDPGLRINDFIGLDIRNNIFVSDGDYAFESDESTAGNIVDFNIYWTPTTNSLFVKNSAIYADLSALQIGEPTANMSSIEIEPVFVGATDLHMAGPEANNVGDNTVGVVDDIDGDSRPIAPSTVVDIGADEYTIAPADDAMAVEVVFVGSNPCGDALTDVYLVFANGGTNDITSLTGIVDISGALAVSLSGSYSGTVASSATDSIFIGTINTSGGGTYTVTGSVALTGDGDGTNNAVTNTIVLFEAPVVDLGVDSTVCGFDFTLDAGNNDPSTIWNWSDGSATQTITVTSADTYWVEVTNADGCIGTDTVSILFGGNVELDPFAATVDICPGDSVQLTPVVTSTNPYTFVWSSGQLTQDIYVSSADVYTFTATDANGCSASESITATIVNDPIAGFTEVLNAEELTATSTAVNADSTVYDFGDGTTASTNNVHTYTANGTFTVCQYVYNSCSSDTICTDVTVTGVGVDELTAENVTLFPNPAEAIINITMNNASAELVRVMTSEGRLIGTYDFNGTTLSIDVSDLPNGVYFVNVEATNGVIVKKFIKE